MGLIIGMIILSIAISGVILGVIICINDENDEKIKKRWSMLGFLCMLGILFGCFTTIKANNVGIIYNQLKGGVQNEIIGEGIKIKSPFEKIYKISTTVEQLDFNDISIQTNDAQFVNSIIQVQVRINKENAFEYFKKYQDKSLKNISSILSNTTQRCFESVTTKYNIMELLGEKRSEIVEKTQNMVKEELSKDGITVERIILIDTDAGDAVEQAIANEAVAKKNAETAEYNKKKAEIDGDAKVIEAQKQKEANEMKQKTLTDEILTEKFIDKWNGELPDTMMSDDITKVFSIK